MDAAPCAAVTASVDPRAANGHPETMRIPFRLKAVIAPAASALMMSIAGCTTDDPVPMVVDTLASPAPPGSGEPNLTVDARGRVYLSWIERGADSAAALRDRKSVV